MLLVMLIILENILTFLSLNLNTALHAELCSTFLKICDDCFRFFKI